MAPTDNNKVSSSDSQQQHHPDGGSVVWQVRLEEIDDILLNFGDSPSTGAQRRRHGHHHHQQQQHPKASTEFWKRPSRRSTDDHTTTVTVQNVPSIQEICEQYAPVNLQSQFEQVYRMLHPGLVQRHHKHNVSVFLEGRESKQTTI